MPPPFTCWTVEVAGVVVLALRMVVIDMTLYQVLAGLVDTVHCLRSRSCLDSCVSFEDVGERDDILPSTGWPCWGCLKP